MFLIEIIKKLNDEKVDYALVGGFALAIHGAVRATMDVDLVVGLDLTSLEKMQKLLKELNLVSRIPVRAQDIVKFRKEYIEKRNLIAWSFVDYQDPTRQLDILIIYDIKDIQKVRVSVLGNKVWVASLDTLLKMKTKAGRPQDLIDIQSIKELINEKNKKS